MVLAFQKKSSMKGKTMLRLANELQVENAIRHQQNRAILNESVLKKVAEIAELIETAHQELMHNSIIVPMLPTEVQKVLRINGYILRSSKSDKSLNYCDQLSINR